MRPLSLSIVLLSVCLPVLAQSQESDEALLTKTRALYDAPFTPALVSFDCAVQFEWKKHFVETLGSLLASFLELTTDGICTIRRDSDGPTALAANSLWQMLCSHRS